MAASSLPARAGGPRVSSLFGEQLVEVADDLVALAVGAPVRAGITA